MAFFDFTRSVIVHKNAEEILCIPTNLKFFQKVAPFLHPRLYLFMEGYALIYKYMKCVQIEILRFVEYGEILRGRTEKVDNASFPC